MSPRADRLGLAVTAFLRIHVAFLRDARMLRVGHPPAWTAGPSLRGSPTSAVVPAGTAPGRGELETPLALA